MLSSKGLILGLVVLFAAAVLAFGYKGRAVGQASSAKAAESSPAQNENLVRLSAPVKPAPEAMSKSVIGSAFDSAALRNSQLQNDLSWLFGGKSQRGWRLYTPLISSIIAADTDAASGGFASALSLWQKENGLEPHGMLDNSTWSEMILMLQSRRIKDRTYPTPDQLVTAPPSDFYDPSRAEELRKFERDTYAAYKRMVQAAVADPSLKLEVTAEGELASAEKYLKIISSFRSREYQEQLRKLSPNSGRAGLAVNSPHFTGRALDIYVGGEPVDTKDANRAIQTETRVYRWLVKNASRFGFQPYFYEPWHWEYVGKN